MDKDNILLTWSVDLGLDGVAYVEPLKKIKGTENFDLEVPENEPVNLVKLAVKEQINPVFIVSDTFTPFFQLFKSFKDTNINYVFCWKVCICADAAKKDEESENTESNILICLKNSESYKKIVKFVTRANITNFYEKPRLDYKDLNELMEGNSDFFDILVPFYSSFIARNLLKFGSSCIPSWGQIKPIFLLQDMKLPFDEALRESVEKYCKVNKYNTLENHHCYFSRREHLLAFQTYLCSKQRSNLNKPEMPHFSSSEFCYEAYKKKIN